MPKIPASGASVPEPEEVHVAQPEIGSQGDDNLETLRRAAAKSIGLEYDEMDPMEYGFLDAINGGELESLRQTTTEDALRPVPLIDNPLIPHGEEETTPLDPADEPLGVTPEAGAEGAEVGLGLPEAPEAGGGGNSAASAPKEEPPAAPSMIPELIDLGDGIMLTREELRARLEQQNAAGQLTPDEAQMVALRRQGLVDYTLIDPGTGLPVIQQQAPQQGAPQQGTPEDWLDPVAYQAFQQMNAQSQSQLQQILANQRQLAEAQFERDQAAIINIVEDARKTFMSSKGMDPSDTEVAGRLDAYLERSGFIAPARNAYPSDPRSALMAAYGAVYGSVPEYQQHERDRIIAEHEAATRQVGTKKAANNAVGSSPGTVSRTTPAPKTQEERMAAAAQLIENDPQWQSSRS